MGSDKIVGGRVVSFRKTTGMNQRDFAAYLGFSPALVAQVESGTPPSRNFLQRLSSRFQVNPTWVLEGREPMIFPAPVGFGDGTGPLISPPDYSMPEHGDFSSEGEEYVLIRRRDLSLSAGTGLAPVEGGQSEQLAFSRSWLLRNSISADLSALVRVKGDSMAPTIPDGSLVLVHAKERLVEHEGIYAFTRNGDIFIKRLIPLDKGPDGRPSRIMVMSDNSLAKSETLAGPELTELNVAGRVRCVLFSV
jgi:phage repressor protein C with HTH and peptisase S24 domain